MEVVRRTDGIIVPLFDDAILAEDGNEILTKRKSNDDMGEGGNSDLYLDLYIC